MRFILEHRAEKWVPVFRTNDAAAKTRAGCVIRNRAARSRRMNDAVQQGGVRR
jgi:hypothetical protein